MRGRAARRLTDRQRAVMERIDRRVPIKVIAQELGVSETRINQHIRALKDAYCAASLRELVENYRATLAVADDPPTHRPSASAQPVSAIAAPSLSEAAITITKTQLQPAADPADGLGQDDPGQLVLGDAVPLIEQAPWLRPGEPRVVPGALDGENAVLLRLAAIVGIAGGILAAVVLTVTAAVALSEAMDGKAAIPLGQAIRPG